MRNELMTLPEIIDTAFARAIAEPSIARFSSLRAMAKCAAIKMRAEGNLEQAAAFDLVADEARSRLKKMMPDA